MTVSISSTNSVDEAAELLRKVESKFALNINSLQVN